MTAGLFTVHTCKGHKPPATAYVAVKYRDYWYYVNDRDQASKTTFALTLELSRLDFGPGGVVQRPLADASGRSMNPNFVPPAIVTPDIGRRNNSAWGSVAAG